MIGPLVDSQDTLAVAPTCLMLREDIVVGKAHAYRVPGGVPGDLAKVKVLVPQRAISALRAAGKSRQAALLQRQLDGAWTGS